MKLSCGCSEDGAERCAEHQYRACHDALHEQWRTQYARLYGACPPCRLAKWRSVSLSSDATPTRKR